MDSSKWTRLMRVGEPPRRSAGLADGFVQELPAFPRYPGRLRHGPAEMVELACEVLQHGLEAATHLTAAIGKEHVRDRRSDHRSDTACNASLRFFGHTTSSSDEPKRFFYKLCASGTVPCDKDVGDPFRVA